MIGSILFEIKEQILCLKICILNDKTNKICEHRKHRIHINCQQHQGIINDHHHAMTKISLVNLIQNFTYKIVKEKINKYMYEKLFS